jgi:TolB protein
MLNNKHPAALLVACFCIVALNPQALAQWENRYPKLSDFGHHVYLEQHELPILAAGPTDPAPAPDGRSLAFSAHGWLWLLDLESGIAERLTDGAELDARPRWSPDGKRLAFVRDTGLDTQIVILDLETSDETLIDTDTIDLDPEFSADGETLFYASASGDVLSLWRRNLAADVGEQITDLPQVERNVRRLPGGSGILYLHSDGTHRSLRMRDFLSGQDDIVHGETLTYHLTADVHPVERLAVFSAPIDNAYHLWTMDLDDPRVRHRLTTGDAFALTPAFSADGEQIYFVTLGDNRQFRLMRIRTYGGDPEPVDIREWRYGTGTARLEVAVRDDDGEPVTARVSISAENGYPVAHPGDATFFDSQTGRHFFYVEGDATFDVPAGRYEVLATRGPMTPVASQSVSVRPAGRASAELSLAPIWDSAEAGYVSADYHVHLNGDGHHRADHTDALRAAAGEDLDHLAPMSWNRWERKIDRPLVGLRSERDGHKVVQGQEVRSHFHGHIGLARIDDPFEPWFFGPSNPTLGNPDLTNGDVIAYADSIGAFPTYVHPVGIDEDPFADGQEGEIPLELVSDGVLSDRMGIELVCAWTSPLGTAEVWYRLLNIGRPVAAISGTDAWVDFHRTPAVGTGRAYVRAPEAGRGFDDVLDAAAAGRSFLTTGPALVFRLDDGSAPGDVTSPGTHQWSATLASTADIDVFEIIVNGTVVERMAGVSAGETVELDGTVELPEAGWVAARAYASERPDDAWPSMHVRPFAHASPIWIGEVGSTDPTAQAGAAADLLRAIAVSEARASKAYAEVPMPRLAARFEAAKLELEGMLPETADDR